MYRLLAGLLCWWWTADPCWSSSSVHLSALLLFHSILFYVQAAGVFAVLMVNCRSMLKLFFCPPLFSPSILFYFILCAGCWRVCCADGELQIHAEALLLSPSLLSFYSIRFYSMCRLLEGLLCWWWTADPCWSSSSVHLSALHSSWLSGMRLFTICLKDQTKHIKLMTMLN